MVEWTDQPPRQVKEASHEDSNLLFLIYYIAYCFNASTKNQCLQYCIHMSMLLSLASVI
jgi:hypothetical protein